MWLGIFFHFLFWSRAGLAFDENDIPEIAYLDTSVNPCDDFYRFACGNFENFHPRPPEVNIVDHFTLLQEELIKIGHEILKSPKRDTDPVSIKKAKSAYQGCVREVSFDHIPELTTIQKYGGMPLISSSNETVHFSWNELADLVANYGIPMIFTYNIVQPNQNESIIMITKDYLPNPSLLRPKYDKSYDDIMEESFKEHARRRVAKSVKLQAFDIFLRTVAKYLLVSSNSSKPETEVFDDLDVMAHFMRAMYQAEKNNGGMIPAQPATVGELQEWTDRQFGGDVDINWAEYLGKIFEMAGVKVTENTKIGYPGSLDYIYGVLDLVRKTDPKVLKNFALLRVILFQAPDSDYVIRKAFEDYYTAKRIKIYPRWEYCTRKILDVVDTASLSFAVAYDYERYHYNINKIPRAVEVVKNIRHAVTHTLTGSDWLDDESREAALKKVENMLVLMAYPDFVKDNSTLDKFYENFRTCEWDNYGNARRIRAFKQAYQFTQLATPDRSFWGLSPFDPNAYYNRPNNRIIIPISLLNPLFFYGDNPILDYSRLGFLVGHELTHAFDFNGISYNENGTKAPLWTDGTITTFTQHTECLIKQYSNYYVKEIGSYVNGSYCINENIADSGGIRTSFEAFKQFLQNESIEVTGNYTAEQLFFIGFGTMWCSAESDNYLKAVVSSANGYPPKKFRVIGALSNMAEFAEAFGCPTRSGMNPESKCVLW